MTIKANCKINLGLNVTRKREDGYHELETVMIPVKGLYDTIELERIAGNDIVFTSSGLDVDCPAEKNLCVRAARLMQHYYNIEGMSIHLDKRVPHGAGLGGGSSDAVAVLKAINEIYEMGLSSEVIATHAAELGSDTIFFAYNSPALCTGRGEKLDFIELDLEGLWLAVVKPPIGVSTAEAYRGVKPVMPEKSLTELLKQPITKWQHCIKNDFEPHIFVAHPEIAELKIALLQSGAIYASMSGSGSALFGIFDSQPNVDIPKGTFLHIEKL